MNLKRQLFTALIGTATLFAGFSNVDCNNTDHLATLNITQGDCLALESFWDATGQGAGWTSQNDANITNDWDRLDTAENWYGITLHPDGGVKWFIPYNNNITGEIPEGLKSFSNILTISVSENHFSGKIPNSLNEIDSLNAIGWDSNDYSGTLPTNITKPNLEFLYADDNHYTGSIPAEYGNFTKLKSFMLDYNQLSGPLPDLSKLTELVYFRIGANRFTFADIEPQIAFIKNIAQPSYGYQADINETDHVVYFSNTLSIEPRLAPNPSKHDYYIWKKDNTAIEDTRVYTDEDYSASRIYVKTNATQADEGCYSYDVNNSRVTLPGNSGHTYLILHSNTCIQAIYDHPPVVSNTPNAQVTIEAQTLYSYTPDATDADSDTLAYSIAEKPSWANFDTATGELSGTPANEDAGSYDINITVTDGKMPVTIAYTLTVTPKDILPASITAPVNNGYTHKITHNTMLTALTPRLSAHWDSTNERFFFREGENCTATQAAYIALDSSGALLSGYEECNNQTLTATLDTASNYPNGSEATLLLEPGTTHAMIMVEIPLTSSITIGD